MKYSLVLLPALAQGAASPTGATITAWPLFNGTLSTLLAADTNYVAVSGSAGGQFKQAAFGYWAYRGGGCYMPGQKFTGGATVAMTVASMGTSGNIVQVFYSNKEAPINAAEATGAGPSGTPGSSDFKNAVLAGTKVLHNSCDTQDANGWKKCYSGNWARNGTNGANADLAKRVILNASGLATAKIKKVDGSTGQVNNISNVDIVPGAIYHVADQVFGTAATGAWCTPWINKLTAAKTYAAPLALQAKENWGKYNKCSWQILTSDGTMGPAFRLSQAEVFTFTLNYQEWYATADLGSNSVLPTAEGSNFYLGKYEQTTAKESYLNPLVTLADFNGSGANADIKFQWQNKSGTDFPAGSIGGVTQFTPSGLQQKFDSGAHFSWVAALKAANAMYDTAKGTYATQATAYNTAADAWNKDKKGDIMAAVRIYPATQVGEMHCPTGLAGIDLSGATVFDASGSTYKSSPYNAVPAVFNMGSNYPSSILYTAAMPVTTGWLTAKASVGTRSNAQGYLQASADTSATTLDASVGHVFGRLGQGVAATPGKNVAPYRYQAVAASVAADVPTIQVHAFPENATALLAATKTITIDASEAAWMTKTAGDLPTCPGKPSALTVLGAQAMAATVVAAATVAATLY